MKRFLIKSGLSGFFLLAFIFGYGRFCDYFFNQPENLDLSEKKQWVLAQKGGVYDYAVLGSSRAYGAFDMNLLDSLTGMNGINLASNGSGFKDNLLVLNLFLKSNSIDKLYLQVDLGTLNSKESFSNEFHAFTFLPYWEEGEVQQVLKEDIPSFDNALTSLLPQWRYFYFNKYFSPKEVWRRGKLAENQTDPFTALKGGIAALRGTGQDLKSEIKLYSQPEKVDPTDLHYLAEILELANSKHIETILFVAPRYQSDHSYLQSVLEQFPHPVLFPKGFDETDRALFEDQGHLSGKGRERFTFLFGSANL